MNERREPTISSTHVDQDSLDSPAPQNHRARRSAPPPVSSRPVVVRSPLGPVAILFALLALAMAGYLYFLLNLAQQQQDTLITQLKNAQGRIETLEQKLEVTGDESSQSLASLQAKIKGNASEIRKLWGVSYDTNKKAIAANKGQLGRLTSAYKSADKKFAKTLEDAKGDLVVLSEILDAQQSVIDRVDKTTLEWSQSITGLQERLQTLETNLNKKVLSNEDAIKAIDAFRVQVNRDLLQLKGG